MSPRITAPTDQELLAILQKVDQQVFTSPEKWTKGSCARTKNGNPVWSYSGYAACFCLVGAFRRVKAPETDSVLELLTGLPSDRIADYNDAPRRTFADIKKRLASRIAFFERRIRLAEERALRAQRNKAKTKR